MKFEMLLYSLNMQNSSTKATLFLQTCEVTNLALAKLLALSFLPWVSPP